MTLLRGRNKPVVKFELRWAHEYLAGPLPEPSFPINVSEGITNFGMMGNDTYGDCGPAAEVHAEMTTAVAAGTTPPSPASPLAVSRYVSYTGSESPPGPGVDLASYLLWCYQQRYIKAFAPLDISNKATMQGLMQAGYGLYIGVNLTDQNQGQFEAGQPWSSVGGIDPNDGHCVLWVGSASPDGLHTVVTWGAVQAATDDWIQACLITNPDGEAFVVITTEEQLAAWDPQLLADVAALGGTGGVPAPTPAPPVTPPEPPAPLPPPKPPAPVPAPPVPPDGLAQWLREMLAWLEQVI